MRQVFALPLKAVGFGRDRVAARMCHDSVQAALRGLPDFRRLCDMLQREIAGGDVEGPALRFMQSLVDETADATLTAMGIDEPDMVSVFIDVERMAVAAPSFEIGTGTSYVRTVSHAPEDDGAPHAVSGNL